MKVFCSAAAIAAASAATAPVIELNMQGAVGAFKLASSIYRAHDLAYTQPDSTEAVASRQDWTEKCIADKTCGTGTGAAGRSVCTTRCPFPVANAYDHQDGTGVEVTTRIFLVDEEGVTKNEAIRPTDDFDTTKNHKGDQADWVDFTKRSTYLFKYDAHDKAGNRAEQVVFALILDDQEAPRISLCNGVAETVEAASDWELCSTSTAIDNIDVLVPGDICYTTSEIGAAAQHSTCPGPFPAFTAATGCGADSHADAAASITTQRPGKFLVTLTVSDKAGVYGRNQHNNVATARKAVLVKDTMDPWINVLGADPAYHQCTRYAAGSAPRFANCNTNDDKITEVAGDNYTDHGALVTDNLDTMNGWIDQRAIETGVADVNVGVRGDYTITYDHTDCSSNAAAQQSRVVKVRDTVSPTVTINGDKTVNYRHLYGNTGNFTHADDGAFGANIEESATAMDLCDTTIDTLIGVQCKDIHPAGDVFTQSSHTSPGTAECIMTWSRTGFRLTGFFPDGSPEDNEDGTTVPDAPLGTYVRTYTVQDNVGNRGHDTRTFNIIDDEAPIITCMKAATATTCDETYEATRNEEYTDKGATCADYVDGDLSHATEVSGQVVNMRVPGNYTIAYDCQDLSGNTASQVQRVVTIQDTTCPVITLIDSAYVYVEAGFPYVDTGATATDDLDGDITALITTDGDTVNTASAFYSRRSCKDIWDSYHADVWGKTGTRVTGKHNDGLTALGCGNYWITTQDVRVDQDQVSRRGGSFDRTEVWCDMDSDDKGTYYLTKTADAVFPADASKLIEECTVKGMVAFTERTGAKFTNLKEHVDSTANAVVYGLDATDASQVEHSATCTFLDEATTPQYDAEDRANHESFDHGIHNNGNNHEQISGFVDFTHSDHGHEVHNNMAETGKYLIQFHIVDNAGNKECQTKVRTVVVRDTLRPVISLHLGKEGTDPNTGQPFDKKFIHVGAAADRGLGNQRNPAGMDRDSVTAPAGMVDATYGNPHLHDNGHVNAAGGQHMFMAEESQASTNGWIVGAAASAITGLALLGYSQRKSTVTTVPV